MPEETNLQAQADEASAQAIHKAKNAQAAIELAREAQLAKAMEEAVQKTKDALLEGLKEVFGDSDSENPQQMKVLVRRIPILCTNINDMHGDLKEIKELLDKKFVTKEAFWPVKALVYGFVSLVLMAVVGALLTLVIVK